MWGEKIFSEDNCCSSKLQVNWWEVTIRGERCYGTAYVSSL